MAHVKMINSVGELVAGEEYDLDADEANRLIVLGWADGEMTREFSDDERAALKATVQEVSV